jgi:hypothetical protein
MHQKSQQEITGISQGTPAPNSSSRPFRRLRARTHAAALAAISKLARPQQCDCGVGSSAHTPPAEMDPHRRLLHGVLETCARSRAGLGQILAPRTVFSHREPSKIG